MQSAEVIYIQLLLQAEMDARSVQFQQELEEKDAEINRLQTEQRVRYKAIMKNSYSIKMVILLCTGSNYLWR